MRQGIGGRQRHSVAVDQELCVLLHGATVFGNLEAALRLRALGEIGEALTTNALVELAGLVTSGLVDSAQGRPQAQQS